MSWARGVGRLPPRHRPVPTPALLSRGLETRARRSQKSLLRKHHRCTEHRGPSSTIRLLSFSSFRVFAEAGGVARSWRRHPPPSLTCTKTGLAPGRRSDPDLETRLRLYWECVFCPSPRGHGWPVRAYGPQAQGWCCTQSMGQWSAACSQQDWAGPSSVGG